MNDQIVQFLKAKQINVIYSEDIGEKLEVWRQWYKGKVDKFHEYKVYTGKKTMQVTRKSLNMAARVCQRWADLLLNEKVEFSVSDDYTQEMLLQLLKQTNFYVRGNNLLETAFALGGGFLVQYWDGEKANQKYIAQEFMYPISYDSGRLTEAAFSSDKTIDGETYVYLETHLKDKATGFYTIDNVLLKVGNKEGSGKSSLYEVDTSFYEEHGITQKWETQSTTPLFQMIRPNVANRDRFDSPYGTSVFNGATSILEEIDTIYDSYYKEFILGKKRIFVEDGVANINFRKNGEEMERVEVFDPNDEVFYRVPDHDGAMLPIQESNPALRVAEHDTALQTQLNCLSQAVGFGNDGFKWDHGNAATATQIISQNSEMFRTIKKHELLLRDSLVDMARGILYVQYAATGDGGIKLDADITIDFDDSIIEDSQATKNQAMIELNTGLISRTEYYRQVYKLTDEQAERFTAQMLEEQAAELAAQPIQEEPEPEV